MGDNSTHYFEGGNWLESAEVTLASGRPSTFKIECDNLTDSEIDVMCRLLAQILPPFGIVKGVPTGGLRVQRIMERYATSGPVLVIDDVWTTGGSMRTFLLDMGEDVRSVGPVAVLFARGPVQSGVTALFTLHRGLWNG